MVTMVQRVTVLLMVAATTLAFSGAMALFVLGLLGSVAIAEAPAIALSGVHKRHDGALNYGAYLTVFLVVVRTFTPGWIRALLWTLVGTVLSAPVHQHGPLGNLRTTHTFQCLHCSG